MTFARVFWPSVCLAALAACSGNIGGGQSTLPGTLPNGTNPQQIAPAAATATPVSASNVATVGDNAVASQALPAIQGWGGSISFPKPSASPSPSPKPKASASAADAGAPNAVSIGITSSVVEPSDAPHLGSTAAKRRTKHDSSTPTGLLFISLLATSDVAFGEYPKIAVDVPRDVVAKYRDDLFALALYDPEQKTKAYRLAVAERDLSSPDPQTLPSATPVPTPPPTPTPTPFGAPNGPGAFTPPPVGSGLDSSSLPPERIAFQAAAANLTLRANVPAVFALYVIAASPSPSPSPKATAAGASSPAAAPSSSPVPSPSVSP
jgi:hypothetical protein